MRQDPFKQAPATEVNQGQDDGNEHDYQGDVVAVFVFQAGHVGEVHPVNAGNQRGRLRPVDHLRTGVRDQTGQHGEAPSLLKILQLVGHDGRCL